MSYWDRLNRQYKTQKREPLKLECEGCGSTSNAVYRRKPIYGDKEGVFCLACYYTVGPKPAC